jgi:exonuclease III
VPAFNRIEDGWMRGLHQAGWTDAFRHLRGESRAYTWYSPNGGNGFRIDQAFLNAHLRGPPAWLSLRLGTPRPHAPWTRASDHAAMVLDLHS